MWLFVANKLNVNVESGNKSRVAIQFCLQAQTLSLSVPGLRGTPNHHNTLCLSDARGTSDCSHLTPEHCVSLLQEQLPAPSQHQAGLLGGCWSRAWKALLGATVSSLHNGHCDACPCRGVGREVITRSSAPQNLCHKLRSSSFASPAFVLHMEC